MNTSQTQSCGGGIAIVGPSAGLNAFESGRSFNGSRIRYSSGTAVVDDHLVPIDATSDTTTVPASRGRAS